MTRLKTSRRPPVRIPAAPARKALASKVHHRRWCHWAVLECKLDKMCFKDASLERFIASPGRQEKVFQRHLAKMFCQRTASEMRTKEKHQAFREFSILACHPSHAESTISGGHLGPHIGEHQGLKHIVRHLPGLWNRAGQVTSGNDHHPERASVMLASSTFQDCAGDCALLQ